MSKSPSLAKVTAVLSMLMSVSSAASQYDFDQPINLSYSDECAQDYCVSESLYTYKPSKNYALNESSDQYDLTIDKQPLYLTVSDGKDWDYLMGQTYTILGLSVATVGLMTLLPESITKWDDDQRDISALGQKWKDNVSAGPVWDRDEHFLNYVMHPYFGGVYYTAARHAGYDEFESFLYSWTMSTFFWEYGVEAFAEVPSWQDLFITPFFGAVVGEMMLEAEQNIVASGGEVMGSQTMGDVSLFFLNPVGHIHYWVSDAWGGDAEVNLNTNPWWDNQDAAKFAYDAGAPYDSQFVGMNFKVTF
ncbi:ubiquitin--protein ligase [Vibrio toranzoniae]|uniref:Ubiquitin--protein ligase n=1 Tax=Vibrio toranzoniae TaxID=1194427 RepID=A0A109DA74_9VIBR|nr:MULTISPECIES: DUF3943 domain-containing protein [Vibrio]KWU01642.1 ubiquitin--protein ligase [Vibrio toranzoniae]MDA0143888.1 DUF3943 domain-containing protein [Vibrio sp. RW]NAZ90617.1 DUF3943 domain-containing protein [Vibrio toranzoniae]SBS25921.1 hypothetical protein VTO7225_00284 [Vibrio toranzoniae]